MTVVGERTSVSALARSAKNLMKTRLAFVAALLAASSPTLAGRIQIPLAPLSMPTLAEWGLLGLALIVAIAAGITISKGK